MAHGASAGDGHLAARLLSFEAHGLRNHLATLRSVTQLLDDPELVEAVAGATASLQVAIERAVVLARVELGERPADVDLPSAELLRLAGARARREGSPDRSGDHPALERSVSVPGAWAERLITDLLHHADGAATASEHDGQLVVECHLHAPPDAALAPALRALAAACGGELDLEQYRAVVRLPLSGG